MIRTFFDFSTVILIIIKLKRIACSTHYPLIWTLPYRACMMQYEYPVSLCIWWVNCECKFDMDMRFTMAGEHANPSDRSGVFTSDINYLLYQPPTQANLPASCYHGNTINVF